VLGVVGELLGDGGIFEAGDRLQALTEVAASNAKTEAAQANERAASLEKEAAGLRLELAKLNLPRSLSPDATNRIARELKRFAGTPYDLSVSPEAEGNFLEDIRRVLDLSFWDHWRFGGYNLPHRELKVKDDLPHAGVVGLFVGVRIVYDPSDEALKAPAEAFAAALTAEGFKAKAVATAGLASENPPMRTDEIHVEIGNRF
jgi:hypothetical protein